MNQAYVAASESSLEAERAMIIIQNELDNRLLKRRQDLEAQLNEIQKNRIESLSAGSLEEMETKVQKLSSEIKKIAEELLKAEEKERSLVAQYKDNKKYFKELIDQEKYQSSIKHDIQEKVNLLKNHISNFRIIAVKCILIFHYLPRFVV